MANNRPAIALSEAEVATLLDSARTAVLVTTGPDGVPDPVGMWFVTEGTTVVMRSYAKAQKVRNLDRDLRAAVLVEDGESYDTLRGVQLSGPISVSHDVEDVLDIVVRLAEKYDGVTDLDRDSLRAYAAKQAVLRLRPARVVSWDHRKL